MKLTAFGDPYPGFSSPNERVLIEFMWALIAGIIVIGDRNPFMSWVPAIPFIFELVSHFYTKDLNGNPILPNILIPLYLVLLMTMFPLLILLDGLKAMIRLFNKFKEFARKAINPSKLAWIFHPTEIHIYKK